MNTEKTARLCSPRASTVRYTLLRPTWRLALALLATWIAERSI
jgi:hypothetical protein